METIRIATRRSPLAVWQAEHVGQRLREIHGDIRIELIRLSTRGDKILDSPLAKVGGKGLFVKELEHALLEGAADIAAHSMKDVPAELPESLHLPVILAREDPRDAFVSSRYGSFNSLPRGARVGTCSLRRQCQLRERRPDLEFIDLRGNVNTRLAKLDAGEFDAIILASAGLKRLGLRERVTEFLDSDTILPAIGQGAIGIECRRGDGRVETLMAPLNDPQTAARVGAERAMNAVLGGGCQVPVAGFAELRDETLQLRGLVGSVDGTLVFREEGSASADDAEKLGRSVAEALLARGAGEVLAEAHAPTTG